MKLYKPNTWTTLETFEWDWFITATFSTPRNFEQAQKTWDIFMQRAARKSPMGARKSRSVGIPWVSGVESHASGSAHIHGLVKGCDAEKLKDIWKDLEDSRIDIRPYDAVKCGFRYVVKGHQIKLSRYFKTTSN